MRLLNIMLAAWLSAYGLYAGAQTSNSKLWSAAKYHDLVVGSSTQNDVLRVLGKPKAVGKEQDTGAPTMTWIVTDPVPGTLVVYTKKGILDGMILTPKKDLTKAEILRLFGSEFRVVRYAMDDCVGEGGAGPIYESPDGPIKHLEYRDRGLAVVYAYDDDEKVEAIIFTSKPFGPTHSVCAAHRTNKPPSKP